MSRVDRTFIIRIRWGTLLAPVCWVRGHRWIPVIGGTWADPSGDLCRRCGRFLMWSYDEHGLRFNAGEASAGDD